MSSRQSSMYTASSPTRPSASYIQKPRLSYKLTLSDWAEPEETFDDFDDVPTDVSDLDRTVANFIRQEAAKKAHDGDVSAKMYRAAKIYFDSTNQEFLTFSQAQYLCFAIRRHFRGVDQVKKDIYHTENATDIEETDAGVMFVRNLSADRFGWAVWSNLDFVYRVVLYDGVLVLAEDQDKEQAQKISEIFCIGYLEDLPELLDDRRTYYQYESLQFTHDKSDNAPALDVLFEFYKMEPEMEAKETFCEELQTHESEDKIRKVMSLEVGLPAAGLPTRQVSAPNAGLTDCEREQIVNQHPARDIRPGGSHERRESSPPAVDPILRGGGSNDGVTVVRIDTFMKDGEHNIPRDLDKRVETKTEPSTSGFYSDSLNSSGPRAKAASVGGAPSTTQRRKTSFSQAIKGMFRRRSAPGPIDNLGTLAEGNEETVSRAGFEPETPRRRRRRNFLRGRNSCVIL